MAEYETFEHDVLVIGAGGAGFRAAIEASATGVRVGLACKSLLGNANTGTVSLGLVDTSASAGASKFSEPKQWRWPPAGSGAPTKSPVTVGNTLGTDTRSRTRPVRNSSTWSLFNFIPRAWSGHRA